MNWLYGISLFSFILIGSSVKAMEPIRDSAQLWDPKEEVVARVEGVRVVLADYNLIRHDFVEVANLTNNQIDE